MAIAQGTLSRPLVPLQAHLRFAIVGAALTILFGTPLYQLMMLSMTDGRYTHIIVVPVISASVMCIERRTIFSFTRQRSLAGLSFLAASLGLYGALVLQVFETPKNYTLSAVVLAIVLSWTAGFTVCYGSRACRAAIFPLLLLLLIVPIPSDVMDKIISVLQRGSAEITYGLFRLSGVPMFRNGVVFELPGLGIEVAAECSSIHSSWALFITGLLLGHMSLKSMWAKAGLSVISVPIAMITNGLRIVTIWFLSTKVDPGFLYGNLHRRGGIVFSFISVSILMSCLIVLRKLERSGAERPYCQGS